MMGRYVVLSAACAASWALACIPATALTPIEVVRSVMNEPEADFDIARDRLTLERLVDPTIDEEGLLHEIDTMADTIRTMAGPSASARRRVSALRAYVYDSNNWNGHDPFQYDMSDPLGRVPEHRMLSQYLKTRKGNCVSMPILFLALAERLNLKATLATAPDHAFVKYTDDVTGKTINLETTSGGFPERDVWLQQNSPMTAESIKNGLYMKPLSPKEVRAFLAEVVIQYDLNKVHRYQEALDIANLIRQYVPHDLGAILTPAIAASWMFHQEFVEKYPTGADIPPEERDRFIFLKQTIDASTSEAEALGWKPPDQPAPSATPQAMAP